MDLHKVLDAFWETIAPLRPTSSDSEYQKVASFIAPDAKLYFNGMEAPPSIGPQGAVEALKVLTTYWELKERKVVTRATSPDGKTVVAEMNNKVAIVGSELDLVEVEFAEFSSDGLITSYRLYVDPEPIKKVISGITSA
jgi:hypothetical protein